MAISRRRNRQGKVVGWQVVLDRRDPDTGQHTRQTIGTYKTKREAEIAEREAVRDFERGTHIDPSTVTVAEWLARWCETKENTVSQNTISDYRTAIRKHITPVLGGDRLQALSAASVQAAYDGWSEPGGLHPRMVHRCHLVLNQACAMAVRQGMIRANPCADVLLPKMKRQEMRVWDASEVRAFLEAADGHRWRALWYLMVVEGLRRGEALGVRWGDYDRGQGVIRVRQTVIVDRSTGAPVVQSQTKTAAGTRAVRLASRTITALDAMPVYGDLITCTDTGKPINPHNVTRAFKMLCLRAGVPEIRVHDMRHTAASLLLAAGVSPKVIQERLGHKSIQVTMDVYSHLLPDMQQSAASAMDALLDTKEPRPDE